MITVRAMRWMLVPFWDWGVPIALTFMFNFVLDLHLLLI
jgi:hypothetical protein